MRHVKAQRASTSRLCARYSSNYCWQVFEHLLNALDRQVDESLRSELYSVLRGRSIARYYGLESSLGLQCMTEWNRPFRGDPASCRLLVSVIRKHENMELVDRRTRKVNCLEAVKLLDSSFRPITTGLDSDPVFIEMRRLLKEILGPAPSIEMIAESARHGPGSSITHSYSDRSSYFKYERWPYAVGRRARNMLIEVIKLDPRWIGALEQSYRSRYHIAPWAILNQDTFWANVVNDEYTWNRVSTVPKDGTKDRPIAIEPPGNIFLQLGIEGLIRTSLKTYGINLDSQERNRRLALRFSKEDRGATIDLSNASDTISREICRLLLPHPWFELLDSVRSPYGEFPDGTGWRYAKMSSMGNGSTFALESLLFYALCRAVSRCYGHSSDRIAVFGDDLLIEGYLATHCYIYLELFGFCPNLKKSFVRGHVRESCGVDAFDGIDIRPVFLKRQPRNDMDIYNDRNRLNRWFAIHHGCSNPEPLDDFFWKHLSGEALLGPESDTEFDSYWHVPDFPAVAYKSLRRRVHEIPARDPWFRKLMHDLHYSSDGGKFLVNEVSEGAISMVSRCPSYSCGYTTDGLLLDHPKHAFRQNA